MYVIIGFSFAKDTSIEVWKQTFTLINSEVK